MAEYFHNNQNTIITNQIFITHLSKYKKRYTVVSVIVVILLFIFREFSGGFFGKYGEYFAEKTIPPTPTTIPSLTPSPTPIKNVQGEFNHNNKKHIPIYTFTDQKYTYGKFTLEDNEFYCNIPSEQELVNPNLLDDTNQKYEVLWLNSPFQTFTDFNFSSDIIIKNHYKEDQSSNNDVISKNIEGLRNSSLSFDFVFGFPIHPRIASSHYDFYIRFFDKEISFFPYSIKTPPIIVDKPFIEVDQDNRKRSLYNVKNISILFNKKERRSPTMPVQTIIDYYALVDKLKLDYDLDSYKKVSPVPVNDKFFDFLTCHSSLLDNYPNCYNKKFIEIQINPISDRLKELEEKNDEKLEDRSRYIGLGIKKGKCIKILGSDIKPLN